MTQTPAQRSTSRTPTVKIGRLEFTGASALIVTLVLFAGLVALIVYSEPRLGMLISGGIWIAFTVYWSVVAAKAPTPTRRAESAASRQRRQLLLHIALLLLFVPVPGLRFPLVPEAIAPFAGLGVQVAGALLYLWCKRELGRNWSGAISIKQDHRLVRSGPYRLVRHPMYTAMLGMAAGTAIVSNQLHAPIGFAVMAYAYWRKISIEERWLREEFGQAYDEYRHSSWVLVPFLF